MTVETGLSFRQPDGSVGTKRLLGSEAYKGKNEKAPQTLREKDYAWGGAEWPESWRVIGDGEGNTLPLEEIDLNPWLNTELALRRGKRLGQQTRRPLPHRSRKLPEEA